MDPKNPTGFSSMPTYGPANDSGHADSDEPEKGPAADLIRQKIEALYKKEPPAKEELKEAKAEIAKARSKHQKFMYELSTSGKPLAEIQTAWHKYYIDLPDNEKHAVWQEFYAEHDRTSHYARATQVQHPEPEPPKASPIQHHHAKQTHQKLKTVSQ